MVFGEVGTNHLGHFYLHHLLVPYLSSSANLVVTASGVHDPESPGGAQGSLATLGNLEGLERDGKNFEMVDGNAFDPDKAYKDSKVCVFVHVCVCIRVCRFCCSKFLLPAVSPGCSVVQCDVYKRVAEEVGVRPIYQEHGGELFQSWSDCGYGVVSGSEPVFYQSV